jgi:putative ABC transport system permease protein
MTELFGIPLDLLMKILLIVTGSIMLMVMLLAGANAIFFKIGVRNIPRRRIQMLLIVFALMLSTTLLSAVLATGDVINTAVQSVAVYNWGSIDELILGGHGPLGTFSDGVYYILARRVQHDPTIAAVAAALSEPQLLVADQNSRQVRGQVTGLGVIPGTERGFGGMQNVQNKKQILAISALKPNQVYLNQSMAQLLNAHTGDTLYVYSKRWPGQRYTMQVMGIVENGGLVGDSPYMLTTIQTFRTIEGNNDIINEIFVANSGGALNGVNLTDTVIDTLNSDIPREVHVDPVKQTGVQDSQLAQNIFSRVFALFALFALAIGLLLIFLIFVLLAAERRAEMGVARAIGVQRGQLVLMFLFEGVVYDVLASFVGLLTGVGLGALLVYYLGPVLARFNFPLKLSFQPRSLIIAYCLGVIFTFCSVALASWLVSRMTIVAAMRDLPEPEQSNMTLGELGLNLLSVLYEAGRALTQGKWRLVRRALLELLSDTLLRIVGALVMLGFLPLLAGYWLMQNGIETTQIVPFSLGLSCLIAGAGLLLQALTTALVRALLPSYARTISSIIRRIIATCIGLALLAYWALPFDILAWLGLPRFQGGIEVFFIAGVMMVFGTVWAVMVNASTLLRPFLALCARIPGIFAIGKLATAYPLHRRFRTGMSVIMFSLVVFAMTVMSVITAAMQNSYVSISAQTGGYDIQGTAYFQPLPPQQDIRASLKQHGINPNVFSAIGERETTFGFVTQLTSGPSRWSIYPIQVISGGFLQGYGLSLVGRAEGFNSDSAVWQALQTHPDYALIDSSALPYNPNSLISTTIYDPSAPSGSSAGAPSTPPNLPAQYTYQVSGIYQGEKSFPAVQVWLTGLQARQAVPLTIIGVVDNSDSAHFGLYVPQSSYSAGAIDLNLPFFAQDALGQSYFTPQTYYFKVAPGQDKRALALALGSAYLNQGLETTVLEDAIWTVRGPRILLSDVLLGVVGLTLLLGVAALAITGTRAVVERRQQIGMLRALGCGRGLIQIAFLLESFLVGALGSILGLGLGLILARNIFAVNFFEQFNVGLTFSIPWDQLGLIIGVALLASFLGALLPAWQAGRVTPAEALRYA